MSDINFFDFLGTIGSQDKDLAADMNDFLLQHGCKCEVKAAAKGYTVSYILNETKKTLANFVCRKTGVKMRLYPRNLHDYEDFLGTLPDKMKNDIKKSSVCKRLLNPDACNPKCSMGYDFLLDGERYQKCRNMAFMPSLNEENQPFIKEFLEKEFHGTDL